MKFKVDFDRNLNNLPKDFINPLNLKINQLIDEFKKIIIKIKENNKSISQQIKDIKNNIKIYKDKINSCEATLVKYTKDLEEFEQHKSQLEKHKLDLKQTYDKLNWQFNESSENINAKNVRITTLKTEISSFIHNLSRAKADIYVLTQKKQDILSDSRQPEESNIQSRLNKFINLKKEKDSELRILQDKISDIDVRTKNRENELNSFSTHKNAIEQAINDTNITLTEIKTNKSSLLENSDYGNEKIIKTIKNIDDEPLQVSENTLVDVKNKIDKLGAINLAAIDELKENTERKNYLDKQYDDLTNSVSTLENAIKKIDNETKSKFKDTFDSINKNLSYFFPKIFGGGKSYLELTDNDLLNTGVNIMAKPPGKLVKNLNLLSGGEKAGTGIAFVFSIFKINPAPFCLLDEVDAPLDEANNERFCNVVKEMSQSVQFIFITHNKSTMQIADVLSGVTMREAGVSKLVSVNVDDALEMTSDN